MKTYGYGALALMAWTVAVFLVARATIPDRSAEVADWRERVQMALDSAAAVRDSVEAAVAARERAAVARAEAAEGRAAAALRQSTRRAVEVATLEAELAAVATLEDTARVQAAMITALRVDAFDLRRSLADAQEAMRGLRLDLQLAAADRRAAVEENQRLTRLLAEGARVTQPSRGAGRTLRTLALGLGLGVVGWEIVR